MAQQIWRDPPSRRNSDISLWLSGGGFAVLVLAVVASWQIRSAFTVGLVAFLAVILFALAEIDLSSLRNRSREQAGLESEQLVRELETAAHSLAGAKPPQSEPAGQQTSDAAEARDDGTSTDGDGRQKRVQLENLLNVAAEWGWRTARLGSGRPPEFVVHWDSDGIPTISHRQ